MALNGYQNKKILLFIKNMQKTSTPVLNALIYYENNIATNETVKDTVSLIVKQIHRGASVEDALREFGVINAFQYAILINAQDKSRAYDQIIKLNASSKAVDLFYLKTYLKAFLSLFVLFFGMPILSQHYFLKALHQVQSIKPSFQFDVFAAWNIDHQGIFLALGYLSLLLFIAGFVFYFYTFNNDLELHYKIFKLRSLNDSVLYFTLIVNMIRSELGTYQIFDLLGKHMLPVSSRDIFISIRDKLKNNQNYIKDFQTLGTNDFSLFLLEMAKAINDVKGGFISALESIRDYKEDMEGYYRDIPANIAFVIMMLVFLYVSGFATVAITDLSFIN